MRWTPVPDGRHRLPDELGYAYRIVDEAAWQRWLAQAAGSDDPQLEVVQHRLRIVDTGPPAEAAPSVQQAPAVQTAPVATETVLVGPGSAPVAATTAAPPPTAPAAAPAPVASAPHGDELTDNVVGIVSQLTGYPPDLLDVDLDLEADLGVDTVKQAEVFAAVREPLRRRARRHPQAARLPDPDARHRLGPRQDRCPRPRGGPGTRGSGRGARSGASRRAGGPGPGCRRRRHRHRGRHRLRDHRLPARPARPRPRPGSRPRRRHRQAGRDLRRGPRPLRRRPRRHPQAARLPDPDARHRLDPRQDRHSSARTCRRGARGCGRCRRRRRRRWRRRATSSPKPWCGSSPS